MSRKMLWPAEQARVAGREIRMRRLTWVVVTVAFLVWVGLAFVWGRWAAVTAQTAAMAAPSTLERVSGIVLYREAGQTTESSARAGMQLYERDELITAVASTADLTVFDGTRFELFPNARLRVNASRMARWSWNPSATQTVFTLVDGAARLSIPDKADKAHTVNVISPHGAAAFVPGEYTLRVGADGTRVSVWKGRLAAAIGPDTIEIGEGQKIIIRPDRTTYSVGPTLENVVANADFAAGLDRWEPWEDGEPGRPDAAGRRGIIAGEGPGAPVRALRVTRVSVLDAHNETGLRQEVRRDVQGARAVLLTARVRLDQASLSGGGYLGSEYPLMFRVRYRDGRESDQTWTQGLYYANPENRPVQFGQRIERGVWTEVSFDLTQIRNPPAQIEALEVFGAGHTFDASVGDIRLLVD